MVLRRDGASWSPEGTYDSEAVAQTRARALERDGDETRVAPLFGGGSAEALARAATIGQAARPTPSERVAAARRDCGHVPEPERPCATCQERAIRAAEATVWSEAVETVTTLSEGPRRMRRRKWTPELLGLRDEIVDRLASHAKAARDRVDANEDGPEESELPPAR